MTIKYYTENLFKFGILTLLYLIEDLIDIENYEECAIIIEAVRIQEDRLNFKLPRIIDKSTIEFVKQSYIDCGLTGKNAEANHKYCAEQMMEEISLHSTSSFDEKIREALRRNPKKDV